MNANSDAMTAPNVPRITRLVVAVLFLWLVLIAFLGGRGDLAKTIHGAPLPVLLAVVVPVLVFFAAFRFSASFRDFVLGFDLRLAAGIQAWRFAGFSFLALMAGGVLPAAFAWPAGVGDMIIGMTAPWVMLALIRDREFVQSREFALWNGFGMLDLIVAVSVGGLYFMFSHGTRGEITTRPMSQLPLALIPCYLVPIFFMLHLAAIFQRRSIAR